METAHRTEQEQAVQAARQLKVNWDKPAAAAFPSSEDLYGFMRTAKPTSSTPPSVVGNPDAAMMTAAKVVEAEYEIPFQGEESTDALREKLAQFYAARTLTKLPVRAEDQAAAIAFLASDAARCTTGQILTVDGGLTESFLR